MEFNQNKLEKHIQDLFLKMGLTEDDLNDDLDDELSETFNLSELKSKFESSSHKDIILKGYNNLTLNHQIKSLLLKELIYQ